MSTPSPISHRRALIARKVATASLLVTNSYHSSLIADTCAKHDAASEAGLCAHQATRVARRYNPSIEAVASENGNVVKSSPLDEKPASQARLGVASSRSRLERAAQREAAARRSANRQLSPALFNAASGAIARTRQRAALREISGFLTHNDAISPEPYYAPNQPAPP